MTNLHRNQLRAFLFVSGVDLDVASRDYDLNSKSDYKAIVFAFHGSWDEADQWLASIHPKSQASGFWELEAVALEKYDQLKLLHNVLIYACRQVNFAKMKPA